jgi:hypothetical protein
MSRLLFDLHRLCCTKLVDAALAGVDTATVVLANKLIGAVD